MLVVDSTVWIDYFKGVENLQTDYLDQIADKTPILMGDLILTEVLQGFRDDADFEKGAPHSGNIFRVRWLPPNWHCKARLIIVR